MADDARNTESPTDRADADAPTSGPIGSEVRHPDAGAAGPEKAIATEADPAAEDGGKIDPQLIGLALVLWLLAMGIFAFKWDRLRVDWYLGNIKETGDLTGRLDESSVEALAKLASADADVLRMVADEAIGPRSNRDELYRSAIVKTIERVPGPEAHALLLAAATDAHGVVRANALVSLGNRVAGDPGEREETVALVLATIERDPEPMTRAFAASVASELGVKAALWPTIRAVRDARGMAKLANAEAAAAGERALREMGARAFYALSGTTPEQLPFDPAAELSVRDAQVRAWERWFVDNGGTIPTGERFEDVYPPQPEDDQSTQGAPPAEASGGGSQGEGQQGSQ